MGSYLSTASSELLAELGPAAGLTGPLPRDYFVPAGQRLFAQVLGDATSAPFTVAVQQAITRLTQPGRPSPTLDELVGEVAREVLTGSAIPVLLGAIHAAAAGRTGGAAGGEGGSGDAGLQPREAAEARRLTAEDLVRMSHGTEQGGFEGLGGLGDGRIDVTYAAASIRISARVSTRRSTPRPQASTRSAAAGPVAKACSTCLRSRYRAGTSELSSTSAAAATSGASGRTSHAAPAVPGRHHRPRLETNRAFLARAPNQRGVVFDRFLESVGMQNADTEFAPLGDDVFTGIVNPNGETSQVCVRTQRVADRLNEQMRSGR